MQRNGAFTNVLAVMTPFNQHSYLQGHSESHAGLFIPPRRFTTYRNPFNGASNIKFKYLQRGEEEERHFRNKEIRNLCDLFISQQITAQRELVHMLPRPGDAKNLSACSFSGFPRNLDHRRCSLSNNTLLAILIFCVINLCLYMQHVHYLFISSELFYLSCFPQDLEL